MLSMYVLMQLFDYKVKQLVKARLELVLAEGFTYANPTQRKLRIYPSEFPTGSLQDLLTLPSNRDILVEFIRRYYRDEILKNALTWLFNKKENELFTYFSEVSDMVDYIGAIKNEIKLSDYIIEYDPCTQLMPSVIPQKNHKDFVRLTKLLRDYANNMLNPEAYALMALFQSDSLNVDSLLSLMEEMKKVNTKIKPGNILERMDPKVTERYNKYHDGLFQVGEKVYATVQEQARLALKAMTYEECQKLISDPLILGTLRQFERGFRSFYYPFLTHSDRFTVLQGILRSGTVDEGQWFVTALLQEYSDQYEAQKNTLPTLLLDANSLEDALQKLNELPFTSIIVQTNVGMMEDIIKDYPRTLVLFYQNTNIEERCIILEKFYDAMQSSRRSIHPDILSMIQTVRDIYLNMSTESANNTSPVNKTSSPMSQRKI